MHKVYIEKNEDYLRITDLNENKEINLCLIQRYDLSPKIGNIFLGTIKNISNRINGYFVDIGSSKDCYMPKVKAHKKMKIGEYVLVEVLKEEIGNKGAVVTSKISLGGNFIVLNRGIGRTIFSKKISNKNTKNKYKNLFKDKDIDIVFRGASEGALLSDIEQEYKYLKEKYINIINKEEFSTKRGLVYENHGIVKEFLSLLQLEESYEFIINDSEIVGYIKKYIYNLNEKYRKDFIIKEHSAINLYNKYDLEEKIIDFRCKRIDILLGGNMIIDRKEALTVIDINSGSENYSNSNINNYHINYECAKIIPKIIISRNLSGIIIIDFINMSNLDEKKKLIEIIREGFLKDRNKVNIEDFNNLNLMHITRERRGKCIYEYLDEYSFNKFIEINRLSFSYVKFYIRNKIRSIEFSDNMIIVLEMPLIYKKDIEENKEQFLKDINLSSCEVQIKYENNLEKIKISKNII